jgi:hypothetical protein
MGKIDGADNGNELSNSRAGQVVGLASDDKHHFSKRTRGSLIFLQGIGIQGDAHAGPFVRHRYLARRNARMPNARQVHLIPSELLEILREEGYDLGPGGLGENVLTAGVDLERLPLKTCLRLGALASVELTGLRTPCVLIDRFQYGLKRRLVVSGSHAPAYRAGVMGVVRSGGLVSVGDGIQIECPAEPWSTLPAL